MKEDYKILVKALGDIKTIKYFDITESEVTPEEISALFAEQNMDHVKVIKYK